VEYAGVEKAARYGKSGKCGSGIAALNGYGKPLQNLK